MELQDHLRDALRARARRRHVEASTYLEKEAGPAFEDVRDALREIGVSCDLEVGQREARLQLSDGQSLRLTLHTNAQHCDVWLESHAYPTFVDAKLWARRWRVGEPEAWPADRVVAVIAQWLARLPVAPEPAETGD